MIKLHSLGIVPNHIPDHVLSNPLAQCSSVTTYCPKDSVLCDIAAAKPRDSR